MFKSRRCYFAIGLILFFALRIIFRIDHVLPGLLLVMPKGSSTYIPQTQLASNETTLIIEPSKWSSMPLNPNYDSNHQEDYLSNWQTATNVTAVKSINNLAVIEKSENETLKQPKNNILYDIIRPKRNSHSPIKEAPNASNGTMTQIQIKFIDWIIDCLSEQHDCQSLLHLKIVEKDHCVDRNQNLNSMLRRKLSNASPKQSIKHLIKIIALNDQISCATLRCVLEKKVVYVRNEFAIESKNQEANYQMVDMQDEKLEIEFLRAHQNKNCSKSKLHLAKKIEQSLDETGTHEEALFGAVGTILDIGIIGNSISLVALIVSIAIYVILRLNQDRNMLLRMHFNLFLTCLIRSFASLIMALSQRIIFHRMESVQKMLANAKQEEDMEQILALIETKRDAYAKYANIACIIFTILWQYAILAPMIGIFFEGLHCIRGIVSPYNATRPIARYEIYVWGTPAVIVTFWSILKWLLDNDSDDCWHSERNRWVASILRLPPMLISFINLVFFIYMIGYMFWKKYIQTRPGGKVHRNQGFRKEAFCFIATIMSLCIIFGIQHITESIFYFLYYYVPSMQPLLESVEIVFLHIGMLMSAFSGFIVALGFGLLNSKIRSKIKLHARRFQTRREVIGQRQTTSRVVGWQTHLTTIAGKRIFIFRAHNPRVAKQEDRIPRSNDVKRVATSVNVDDRNGMIEMKTIQM